MFQFILLASSVVTAPQVELSTLTGAEHQGELVALDAASLTLKKGDEAVKLPLAGLLNVRFASAAPPGRVERGLVEVAFRDGSRFHAAKVSAAGRRASFAGGRLGEFSVPRTAILSIRYDADRSVDDAWKKLLQRKRKRDLLVIKKKGEVVILDFLEGIVGGVDSEQIRFLLDGDEIPVPRQKVFGVIYADRKQAGARPLCKVRLHHSGELLAAKLAWTGTAVKAALATGGDVEIPAEAIRELDFSLGKVQYLSQMKPREEKITPFFPDDSKYQPFMYRRDKNLVGGPLRLGGKTYARGLCIHSKTTLVYRINTEFRRFIAVVGIDHAVAKNGLGDVHLVITDRDRKKVLFEADVSAADEPRAIDLDVSQVRDLEILVDFCRDRVGEIGISDWLDLADARVTK